MEGMTRDVSVLHGPHANMRSYEFYTLDTDTGVFCPPKLQNFAYSDGLSEEQRLLQNLKGCTDTRVFSKQLGPLRTSWPTNYHLSPLRGNLLRPFVKELRGASVLEIGAGCGAITRFAAEIGASVTALEGSLLRASVAAARCRGLENVRVVCDNFQNFHSSERFDVVTLIGVLEYAQLFMGGKNPVCLMLERARSFLKPGGFLLLAIENQLGLKYFCGAPEDHVRKFGFGINDSYSDSTVVTFGRAELESKLHQAGFLHAELFLPFPDYKMPSCILHPEGGKNRGDWEPGPLVAGSVLFEAQPFATPLFSLEQAWRVVARNGLLPDMANSFLFRAFEHKAPRDSEDVVVLASHYGNERPEELFTEKVFVETRDSRVETRIFEEAIPSAKPSYRTSFFYPGQLHGDGLLKLMNTPNWTVAGLAEWARPWVDALRKHVIATDPVKVDGCEFNELLPANFPDAIPTNLAVPDSGPAHFFDIELKFHKVLPLEFVIFRGLAITIHRVRSCARPSAGTPLLVANIALGVMEALGINLTEVKLSAFMKMLSEFHNRVDLFPLEGVHPICAMIAASEIPVRPI
jgi:SAM-dependent methyltransferase